VKAGIGFTASPWTSADTCPGIAPFSVEWEYSGLSTDAAAGKIVSKVKIKTEAIIRIFSSFRLPGGLIVFGTGITPLSNRGGFRSIWINFVLLYLFVLFFLKEKGLFWGFICFILAPDYRTT
jgi:hypothetical protein